VIVIASIPFLRPLFIGPKAFSWAYYRSLLARYSARSRSSSGDDHRNSDDSDDAMYGKRGKGFQSLPHIPKDRFVTTTLRNAGMETAFERSSYLETGDQAAMKR